MTQQKAGTPFRFYTEASLIELTGMRARNLRELMSTLKEVPGSVIYYHTHHFLRQHQYLSPEPPNDFAYWAREMLGDRALGERLSAIDTVRFPSIRTLRARLIAVLKSHIEENGDPRSARSGDEFHFMKARSFVFPTAHEASTLEEFAQGLRQVSINSLYHHIFEARLRLERGVNDFSNWLELELGEKELARQLASLDPYTQTLEALRQEILRKVERRLSAPTKASAE